MTKHRRVGPGVKPNPGSRGILVDAEFFQPNVNRLNDLRSRAPLFSGLPGCLRDADLLDSIGAVPTRPPSMRRRSHHMSLRPLRLTVSGAIAAGLLAAMLTVRAAPIEPKLLSDIGRASMHTLGIVQGPATSEVEVFAFSEYVRRGMAPGSSYSREHGRLLDIEKLDLHGQLMQALLRRLAAMPSPLQVHELPMPSGARGIYQAAQKSAPDSGVDAVLSFFVRVGYCAFKPDQPYLPFVAARVTLLDTRSGRTILDDDLSAGPAPTAEDAVQVPVELPRDGAVALADLNADPAQAAKAWQVQIEALADRMARQLTGPPPMPVPSRSATMRRRSTWTPSR